MKNSDGQKIDVAIALVHWPILDRAGNQVVTNVTNFDIHDIARAARTYGVRKYFIVNRLKEQLMFVSRVLEHWRVGAGSQLNPMRRTALHIVEPAETIESVLAQYDQRPLVVATAARDLENPPRIGFSAIKQRIADGTPVLLVFGTGFGLDHSALQQCDFVLEPIKGASEDDYRHLSVRSAVSICLDRLLGSW